MTKAQKIAELKAEYPTLQKGVNDEVIELDAKEYEATIEAWAVEILAKETEEAAEATKTAAAASAVSKLEAIGLTAEEIAALRG